MIAAGVPLEPVSSGSIDRLVDRLPPLIRINTTGLPSANTCSANATCAAGSVVSDRSAPSCSTALLMPSASTTSSAHRTASSARSRSLLLAAPAMPTPGATLVAPACRALAAVAADVSTAPANPPRTRHPRPDHRGCLSTEASHPNLDLPFSHTHHMHSGVSICLPCLLMLFSARRLRGGGLGRQGRQKKSGRATPTIGSGTGCRHRPPCPRSRRPGP